MSHICWEKFIKKTHADSKEKKEKKQTEIKKTQE